jgi:RNA polymerase sigma factor (sigma-70 family)
MDDLGFVQRCTRGDKLAWDEFVDKYSNLIYRYILSVLKLKGINSSHQDIVKDLFQEIFISLANDDFKKLRSYKAKNGCSLASWLRQVVIHYTIDYVRKLKPVVSLEEEIGDDFSLKETIADDSLVASDILVAKDNLEHLTDCIQQLDNDDKYFLELHINKGLTLVQLEQILRISRSAVDMRKARIISKLRDCFRGKGF